MIAWETLDRAPIPGGGELTLVRRGHEFAIRVNGAELMASRAHASEERMAEIAAERLGHIERPRVMIGGLGLGYTLRATLDRFPAHARIVVAELIPDVIRWMRGPLAHLAGRPLDDSRVEVLHTDATALLRRSPGAFHALLMDIDNSPSTLIRAANATLYSERGLVSARASLAPGGVLVVWSAGPDARFAERMRRAGFIVRVTRASAHSAGRGRTHTLFIGETPAAGRTDAVPRSGMRSRAGDELARGPHRRARPADPAAAPKSRARSSTRRGR
jgi:spermidine synthase